MNGEPLELIKRRLRARITELENYEQAKLSKARWNGKLARTMFEGVALALVFWGFWVYVGLPFSPFVTTALGWLSALALAFLALGAWVDWYARTRYKVRF